MLNSGPRKPTTEPATQNGAARQTRPPSIPLVEYLSLREVPWTLAYVGFLFFFVAISTYLANIGVVAMAVALLALFLGPRSALWPRPALLLTCFWIWAAMATALSNFVGDFEPLVDLGKVLLVFLIAVNVLGNRLALRSFLLIYLACFALFPVRGTLANYFVYDNADFGRPSWVGVFGNPNDVAALTILALALAIGFLHRETPRVLRFAALLLCIVFPFVILLSQSRGAFIGTCVFLLLSFLSISRNRMRAIVLVTIVGTILIAAAPSAVWQRLAGLQNATSTETIAEMDTEGSAAQRWEIWQTGFHIIDDHPFVGVGRGGSPEAVGIYNAKLGRRSLHNTFLEVLAETGVPGLVLFFWFLLSLLFRARRARRNASALRDSADWRRLQLIEFGLYGYLVAGIWGTYGYISLMYVYLAILFAQSGALDALAQEASTGQVTSNSI